MEFEPLMQRLLGDATSLVAAHEESTASAKRLLQSINALSTAMSSLNPAVTATSNTINTIGTSAANSSAAVSALTKNVQQLAAAGGATAATTAAGGVTGGKKQGYGRYILAGGIAGIGSQLGPLGEIAGGGIGGGLITGSMGGALAGTSLGTAQASITLITSALETFKHVAVSGFDLALGAGKRFLNFLVELTESSIKLGAGMELLGIKFEVLSKGAMQGQQLFGEIQAMSIISPYSINQLTETSELLLGMGINVNSLIPTLNVLGDLAAGSSDRMLRLARVMEQVSAEGFVSGFRLRALSTLGIGINDLAKTLDVTKEKLTSMLHAGDVSANDLIATFNRLVQENERFGNFTGRILATVSGRWQQITNQIDLLKAKIGEGLLVKFDVAGKLGSVSTFLTENAERIQSVVMQVFDRIKAAAEILFSFLKAGWGLVLDKFGLSGKTFEEMLPSMAKVQEAMKAIIHVVLNLSEAIIQMGRVGTEFILLQLKMQRLMAEVLPVLIILQSAAWGAKVGGAPGAGVGAAAGALVVGGIGKATGIPAILAGIDKSLADLDKLGIGTGVNKGADKAVEIIAGLRKKVDALKGIELPGGGGPGVAGREASQIPLEPYYPSKGRTIKAMQEWDKMLEEGISPSTKILEQFRLSQELIHGKIMPPGFIGPAPGPSEEEIKIGRFGGYQALQKALQQYKVPEESLTAPTLMGSQAAVDIINRSTVGATSFHDKVMAAMDDLQENVRLEKEAMEKSIPILEEIAQSLIPG